jgi:hypothetical protein
MAYLVKTVAVSAIYLTVNFLVCLFLPSPIPAEYWVRELIVVKEKIADTICCTPRILFLGGSSSLFGIDAEEVTAQTGMPAVNMGLHAGLRLDRVLSVGEHVVRRGDVLVLPLEQPYYTCGEIGWSDWQITNALAWDRPYFDNLSLGNRIQATFDGGGASLMPTLLGSKLNSIANPELYFNRLESLAPAEVIWARYSSGKFRTSDFAYSAYNIDGRGDMLGNEGAHYSGPGEMLDTPRNICPDVSRTLTWFVSKMKRKGIQVLVSHVPYIIERTPNAGWREAEKDFRQNIKSTGAALLDHRQDLFFPPSYFFNSNLHLNDVGRREWTKRIIYNLRRLGVAQSAW